MKTILVENQTFQLICTNIRSGRSTYRGQDTYLRIGPPSVVHREATIHRRLASLGFPIAALLSEGEHNGLHYFIESAVGEQVFGDIFDQETADNGAARDTTFALFLDMACRWASAQLRHAASTDCWGDFSKTSRLVGAQRILPDCEVHTEQAFAKALERLCLFPSVWTHGDYHAYNVCEQGVIDLEEVRLGIGGYDLVTGILVGELFPPDPAAYRYTARQIETYLQGIDHLFAGFNLPAPSAYAQDFCMCKMICIVNMAESWPQDKRQWVHQKYRNMIQVYL